MYHNGNQSWFSVNWFFSGTHVDHFQLSYYLTIYSACLIWRVIVSNIGISTKFFWITFYWKMFKKFDNIFFLEINFHRLLIYVIWLYLYHLYGMKHILLRNQNIYLLKFCCVCHERSSSLRHQNIFSIRLYCFWYFLQKIRFIGILFFRYYITIPLLESVWLDNVEPSSLLESCSSTDGSGILGISILWMN